jgi:hypothetical protein
MSRSSLEERISDLCSQATATSSQAELDIILPKLQAALREHVRNARAVAIKTIPKAFGNDNNAAD